jgi:hypothetical protein
LNDDEVVQGSQSCCSEKHRDEASRDRDAALRFQIHCSAGERSMVHVEHERGIPRGRRTLPLTIPFLLALTVWATALWDGPSRVEEDWLAGELRRFRTLAEPGERVRAIQRLGPIRDPRVTVALMDVALAERDKARAGATETSGELLAASFALFEYHIPEDERVYGVKYWTGAMMWWNIHEADVRQRAAALPR